MGPVLVGGVLHVAPLLDLRVSIATELPNANGHLLYDLAPSRCLVLSPLLPRLILCVSPLGVVVSPPRVLLLHTEFKSQVWFINQYSLLFSRARACVCVCVCVCVTV
jgi:hypothetical protein